MYQGLRRSRLWLALILVAFCLPLFIGLGDADLETDEAIYSFAVDRILVAGDWLEPKSSPSDTTVFLEKPPLKFWMVAAPIKAGLLPDTEFGLRFIDVVEASAAFVYVFAIGTILIGPVCGAVAVLLLFVHWPLVHVHGLRTNNMEASLLLSYCGGVFHFLRWAAVDDARGRRTHAVWATLFFVLGFMTKFVAALFLPFTLGLAVLVTPRVRARFFSEWRLWTVCAALVVAVCAPWFVYAHVRFGGIFWQTILGDSVFKRMTVSLDPTHVHPWNWYVGQMWMEFGNEGTRWLHVAGLVVLAVQTLRRRWFDGLVIALWATVPMAIISGGTSKLYHYTYPYLPPITLASGYLVALVVALAPAPLRKVFEWVEDRAAVWFPGVVRRMTSDTSRRVVSAIVVVAAALAIGALILGSVRLQIGSVLVKSSSITRPIAVILLLTVFARTSTRMTRLIVALLVCSAMPMAAYRGQMEWMEKGKHPIRTAASCLLDVQRKSGTSAGLYMDMPNGIWHPLYYYFRRVTPVTEATSPLDPVMDRYLLDPAEARPILVADTTWRDYNARRVDAGAPRLSPPMLPMYRQSSAAAGAVRRLQQRGGAAELTAMIQDDGRGPG
ncbi:MAG: hypothetical protein QM736_22795 [Vicinamibacterales bacterium]